MTKRKMPKQRPLAFESLETRTLLAIIGGAGGFVEVEWNQPVPPVAHTHEQAGGPTYDFKVRLYPTLELVGNPYDVKVSFAPSVPGEATIAPASVTFAAGEANGNPSEWKYFSMTGKDDFPAETDDGNIGYSIAVSTTSTHPTTFIPDPNFTGINGPAGSFTNLDNDLLAEPDSDYSVFEMDASIAPGTVYSLNVGANDHDLGGDGSWHITSAGLIAGQGEVTIGNPLPPIRSVRYRPADDWYGDFTISYCIENEWGRTSVTDATGTVVNVPDKPVANHDSDSTAEDTPKDIDPSGNDTDVDNWPVGRAANFGLTAGQVGTVVGGSATIVDGKIRFVPAANWNSECNEDATIQYKAKDAEGNLSDNWATVTVEVTPSPDPPEAHHDFHLGSETEMGPGPGWGTWGIGELGNDTDPDCPDVLTVSSYTQPVDQSYAQSVYLDKLGGLVYSYGDLDELILFQTTRRTRSPILSQTDCTSIRPRCTSGTVAPSR